MEREAAVKEWVSRGDMSTMFRELVDAVEHLVNFAVHSQTTSTDGHAKGRQIHTGKSEPVSLTGSEKRWGLNTERA